jgi:hypothetical protein
VERVEETDGGKRTIEIDRDKRRWKGNAERRNSKVIKIPTKTLNPQ